MKKIIFILLFVPFLLQAEEIRDQKWQWGDFSPAIDKQAHFLGGFGAYSCIERVTDNRFAQYGFVLLISGVKEAADSWRTVGDIADVTYAMAGSIACDYILTKLKLKSKHIRLKAANNKISLAVTW